MSTSDTSAVILSIRLIRSFEHRNLRFFPLHQVDLHWTTEQLKAAIQKNIDQSKNLPPPFKKFDFDTLKVMTSFFLMLRKYYNGAFYRLSIKLMAQSPTIQ